MSKNRSSENTGPSQRQLRVGELIRRTLSDVLQRGDLHDPDIGRMSITVGEVRVTPDLRTATAFVLPLGGGDREAALLALRRNTAELRHLVVKGMTIKFAPELKFAIDETYDRIEETRRMFADATVRKDVAAQNDTVAESDAVNRETGQSGRSDQTD